jgi:peptidyl-tRNA hydrolase, PTH1 family
MLGFYLLVGLGNPGDKYIRTRHNAGFLAADNVAQRWKVQWENSKRFEATLAIANQSGFRSLICKPQTFMNSSGVAVGKLMSYFRIPPEKILVIVDDANMPFGQIRLRGQGSSGGHHGLESIERHIGTQAFVRLKIGIGRQADKAGQITKYVLSRFSTIEWASMNIILDRVANQIECWLFDGLEKAMNKYNGVAIDSENNNN